MWFAWSAQFTGFPLKVLAGIRKLLPDYVPAFHGGIFTIALLFTLGWMALVTCHRREGRFVAAHWTAGIALVYLLGMTLWLPVANANMSYRHDFAGLRDVLGNNPGLICGRAINEPQRAMLHYFVGARVVLDDIAGRWIAGG